MIWVLIVLYTLDLGPRLYLYQLQKRTNKKRKAMCKDFAKLVGSDDFITISTHDLYELQLTYEEALKYGWTLRRKR